MGGRWSKSIGLTVVTACGTALCGPLPVRAEGEPATHAPRITARLISDETALVAGKVAHLGLHLQIVPGWHTYWNGVNDTGFPVKFTPHLPAGLEMLPAQWPAPARHISPGGILDHIYENEVTIILPVRVAADAAIGPRTEITMDVEWLVCKDVCVPEDAAVAIALPVVATGQPVQRSADSALFDKARARLPRPLPSDTALASASWKSGELVLTGRPGSRVEFYPGRDGAAVTDPLTTTISPSDRLTLRFEGGGPVRAQGVFAVWPGQDAPAEYYEIDTAPPN